MQKPNPDVSNIPSLDDLPDPPERVASSSVVLFSAFAGIAAYNENWYGMCLDLAVLIAVLVFGYIRWQSITKLRRQWRLAKLLEKLIKTPMMREEANSVIFTFIFPSPELMEELNKIHNEATSSG